MSPILARGFSGCHGRCDDCSLHHETFRAGKRAAFRRQQGFHGIFNRNHCVDPRAMARRRSSRDSPPASAPPRAWTGLSTSSLRPRHRHHAAILQGFAIILLRLPHDSGSSFIRPAVPGFVQSLVSGTRHGSDAVQPCHDFREPECSVPPIWRRDHWGPSFHVTVCIHHSAPVLLNWMNS